MQQSHGGYYVEYWSEGKAEARPASKAGALSGTGWRATAMEAQTSGAVQWSEVDKLEMF